MPDKSAGDAAATPAAEEQKPSEMELLTRMLQQQQQLDMQQQQQQQQLDMQQRMTALMERWGPAAPPATLADAASVSAGPAAAGARPRARLPAAGTPIPRLSASATLMEFEAWRKKFEGYCLLSYVSEMTPAEQTVALLAVLDDDWTRVVRFGLPQLQQTPAWRTS